MAAQHHDLAAAPYKPSRVLTQYASSCEAARRQAAAQRDTAAAMADFRRFASGRPQRKALDAMLADLPQPAFAQVSGQRAFAANQDAQERNFSAAGTDRLTAGWQVFNTGINADLEAALSTLRARSRDWMMNTDMGERYGALVADNIVGADAPRLQMRVKLAGGDDFDDVVNAAVEQAWAEWCERGCEVTGQLTFGQVCRMIAEGTARDGEFLARQVRGAGYPHGYSLQMLDVDRIDTARNVAPALPGGNGIRLGVEIDALGRKQALHLTYGHPGDPGAGIGPALTSDRVPMQHLLHGFVQRRQEQVRGYPWASAVLRRANMLDGYEQYAMVAARVGAAKMGFYTTSAEAAAGVEMTWEQLRQATGELVQDVEAGMLEALPPGVDFKGWDPAYPHQNYTSFVDDSRRSLSAGLNVAHHSLSGNMSGVNYSSARIAELSERRHWRALQRWMVAAFVRPVFEGWLAGALLTRSITMPDGSPVGSERLSELARAASFQPPKWDWVDPQGDTASAAMEMTYDMRSPYAISDQMGIDLDETLQDKARLLRRYRALGLPVPAWMAGGTAVMAPGAPKPEPAPKPSPAPAPESAPAAQETAAQETAA